MQEIPQNSDDLRSWLRELKDLSGLSFEELGQAIEEPPRNLKRWLRAEGKATLPSGDVILRLLSALGVTFNPPAPVTLRALSSLTAEIRAGVAEVDEILRREREAEAGGPGVLQQRLDEVANLAAADFEDVKQLLADVARRLPVEDGQGRTAEV